VALGSVGPGSLLGAFGSEQTPPRLSDGSNADLWDGAAQADGAYTVRSLRGRGRERERERAHDLTEIHLRHACSGHERMWVCCAGARPRGGDGAPRGGARCARVLVFRPLARKE
jgi:hypothetical protein